MEVVDMSDVTPLYIPIQVWLELETAKLCLGIFAPSRMFIMGGKTYELLGEL